MIINFNLIFNKLQYLYCDLAKPWGLYFQDSASPQMEAIIELHNYVMLFLITILVGVLWLFIVILYNFVNNKFSSKFLTHGTLIELIWTISPALVLILIAFPSFKLLYITDDISDPEISLIIEAHQWYWSYEYPDFLTDNNETIALDSYLINVSDLEKGQLRMLDVDNRLILPELTHVRFNLSSTDVIHSLASPSLGLKCDAYPFKTNQISVYTNREGTYYGQCSEICGIWHSSMPIVIESVSLEKFLIFLKNQ